jgi:predicted MFS family arabinose efflux permease
MFSIFILGGGIYNIMEKPLAITPGAGQSWTFYVPYDINKQTLNESIIAMLLFVMGVAGYLVYYLSTRYVYSPRRAWILALIGMSMLIIAFVGSQHSLNLKVPSG